MVSSSDSRCLQNAPIRDRMRRNQDGRTLGLPRAICGRARRSFLKTGKVAPTDRLLHRPLSKYSSSFCISCLCLTTVQSTSPAPSSSGHNTSLWNRARRTVSPTTHQSRSRTSQAHPTAPEGTGATAGDVILQSTDSVSFTVHQTVLLAASTNNFNRLLPPRSASAPSLPRISVNDGSVVVYFILDAVYASSGASKFIPPSNLDGASMVNMESLSEAVGRLPAYGLRTSVATTASSALYKRLCEAIPHHPMKVFSLAAHHGLEDLCVQASSHLLSPSNIKVTPEERRYIGTRYYDRLVALHNDRLEALKAILSRPPAKHMANLLCTEENQNAMVQQWEGSVKLVLEEAKPCLCRACLVVAG